MRKITVGSARLGNSIVIQHWKINLEVDLLWKVRSISIIAVCAWEQKTKIKSDQSNQKIDE